ncbi:MAG: SusC/RagA family TonB-linked outer membrane protein [Pedobacter sp.]|nr:MAG: SusC/RagA family TonB-linked outer membrane protein [Pedobacter sp.]
MYQLITASRDKLMELFLLKNRPLQRVPKTVSLILLLFFTSVSIKAQQVTVDVNKVPLKELFRVLRVQTGFDFLYANEDIQNAKPVSLNVKNETLKSVLDKSLSGQQLSYSIVGKSVTVKKTNTPTIRNEKITGKVTDSKGEPIPGVSVKLKDGTASVVTNTNGDYVIEAPNSAATLVFSYLGFTTEERPLQGRIVQNVTLQESTTGLDQVLVVGYGTVKKSDLTGSVSSVKMEDLQKAPVLSFEDALGGRIAGVQVTSSEGGPGAENNIVIRGGNSITQSNSPLYIIDGFPIENPANNAISNEDIESITVLKDASSTAIYGSRGANGVIVITTKQGKVGKPVINFNGYYGIQNNIKQMDLLDPYEYVKLQIEMVGNAAKQTYTPGDPSLGATAIPGGRELEYYRNQPYVNWQDQIYHTAPMQNYNLSLSGGKDQTRYSISGSLADQKGTIIGSGFKRYQGRFVFNQGVSEKLSFNLNVNYARTENFGSSPSMYGGSFSNSLLYAVWGYRPAISPNSTLEQQLDSEIDPDGQVGYAFNPLLSVQNETVKSSDNNITANAFIDYKFSKDLTLKVSGGLTHSARINDAFYNSRTGRGAPTNIFGPNGQIANLALYNLLNENTLTYRKIWKRWNSINIVGGFTAQKYNVRNNSLMVIQVPNENLGINDLDNGQPYNIGSSSSGNFLNSYFGRVNYAYKSKIMLTATFRADGSSKFAEGNKWSYFPSGAVAWTISREKFMQKIPQISNAKIRTSFGVTGNNRVSDFPYLSPVNFAIDRSYAFGNQYMQGAVPGGLGNRNLQWETTSTYDAGIDLGFFKNRVEITADYYRKVTSDLLLNADLPSHIGFARAFKNVGKVENSGIELEVSSRNIVSKSFSWSSSFNIAFNRNKVLALTQGQDNLQTAVAFDVNSAGLYPYIAIVGQPVAQFFGYKWVGNYQLSDFDRLPDGNFALKSNVPTNGTPSRTAIKPGDIKYEDMNGDLAMTTADRVVIGNPNPDFIGGFSNNFNYKNFDLNVFFQFSVGNDVLNANRMVFEGMGANWQNSFASFANRWTPENPNNEINRANGGGIQAYSSRIIEDGSFLRLKTVALGYTFPKRWLSAMKVNTARVYLSAQNLAVWSKYKGSDPEVSTRNTPLTPGFDFAAYPRARTVTFGFNFSF